MGAGSSYLGVKAAGAWSWPSSSSTEVKMNAVMPPLLQYVFTSWGLVKHRNSFTFTFYCLKSGAWNLVHIEITDYNDEAIQCVDTVRYPENFAMKADRDAVETLDIIRGCIQKFPDWPPGARTGTALCHYVQLYRYFVSQSSEFCRHNPLRCFSTSVCCCLFRYRLSPETFGYTLLL
jgi:hypothetical protein